VNIILIKIKCLRDYGISLKKDKIYDSAKCQFGWQKEKGWFALVDETGEEYAYPPHLFEVVETENVVAVGLAEYKLAK
jgi:hypothetical protein